MRRVLFAFALLALALPAAAPTQAQDIDPATIALTEADVGGGLRRLSGSSGSVSFEGRRVYVVAFEGESMVVQHTVLVPRDAATALEQITREARFGYPSAVTEVTPPPPIGDESRAFTHSVSSPYGGGGQSVGVAATFFRRHAVVVGVVIISRNAEPNIAEAVRLAAIVDARLVGGG